MADTLIGQVCVERRVRAHRTTDPRDGTKGEN